MIRRRYDRVPWLALPKRLHSNSKGQALVEFTLVFVLLVLLTWIPAEFGLAFYTGQLAQSAAREGARLAAASKDFNANDIITQTCQRLSSALLIHSSPNCAPYSQARVIVTAPSGVGCDQRVSVTVLGDYNFYFYQLLRLISISTPNSISPIIRTTNMRYEWQTYGCS